MITKSWNNHTYQVEKNGQVSVQHESRLKLHKISQHASGQAPVVLEPSRRPNMKGAVVKPQRKVKEPVGSEAMFREGEDNSKLDGQLSTADTSSKVEVTIRDNNTTAKPPPQDPKGDETIKQEPGSFRNSGRVRKLPAHLTDYVLDYTAVSFIEYK